MSSNASVKRYMIFTSKPINPRKNRVINKTNLNTKIFIVKDFVKDI